MRLIHVLDKTCSHMVGVRRSQGSLKTGTTVQGMLITITTSAFTAPSCQTSSHVFSAKGIKE